MSAAVSTIPTPSPCFDVLTDEGYKAFSAWLFASQTVAHAKAAIARAAAPVRFSASDSIEPFTQAELAEMDMIRHRWKESGGPVRDHDARAVAIERGSRRFS